MFNFHQNLIDLGAFYKMTIKAYKLHKDELFVSGSTSTTHTNIPSLSIMDSSSGRHVVETDKINQVYLVRAVILLLCALWEDFANHHLPIILGKEQWEKVFPEIEKRDRDTPPRFCFNSETRNLFLMRNCIIHNNGKVDEKYKSLSGNPFGLKTEREVDLSEGQIEAIFTDLRKAYEKAYS